MGLMMTMIRIIKNTIKLIIVNYLLRLNF